MDTQTARAPTSDVLDGLNDLLQLDHDAVGAYDVAMDKLQDRDYAAQIAGYRRDHERHIRELNELIAELGGTPKNEPHATGPFKQALQSLGGIAGDKGLLISWRTNELATRTKYDSYAQKANHWPANVKAVVDRAALDEERHYRWVADVLQHLGVGSGEGVETDLANKMRERAGAAAAGGSTIDNVKERVSDLAEQARTKVSDLTDTARTRVSDLAGDARDRVVDIPGAARERVASGLDAAAGRLSSVGQDANSGPMARVAPVAAGLGGGLASTARFVREGDAEQIREGVEGRVRESPAQTLLIAAVAGFVVGRLLR